MTRTEAKEAIERGERVRHEKWQSKYWVKKHNIMYLANPIGALEPADIFWGRHIHDEFNTGWMLYEEPKEAQKPSEPSTEEQVRDILDNIIKRFENKVLTTISHEEAIEHFVFSELAQMELRLRKVEEK